MAQPIRRLAGPVVIVAAVLFAMRSLAFHPMLSNQQPDLLPMWLSRFAFLGRSLRSGHIPLWNPYEMLGYRFAADPQSGWLYAPAMLLYTVFDPAVAERILIVANPIVAGLAIHAFLRKEDLGRPAATAGGLSVAMAMAASDVSLSLPFAGSLAWAAVLLLAASGYRHTATWASRLAWLALGAFAWSQAAAAHMSHGLIFTTILVVGYLVASTIGEVRAGAMRARRAVGHVALFLAVLPVASVAILVPRLAFIHGSSLGGGYGFGGHGPTSVRGVWSGWPFALASVPGAYLGSAILIAVPAAFRARRRRWLVIGMAAAFAIVYVAMSPLILEHTVVPHLVHRLPFGDVLLHDPQRFRYLAILAVPVIGAAGIQGLVDEPTDRLRTALLLGAGVLLWIGVPLAFGAKPVAFLFVVLATLVAAPLLWLTATRRETWWAAVVTGVLAFELIVGSVVGMAAPRQAFRIGLEGGSQYIIPKPLRAADVPEHDYLTLTPFVARLRDTVDRYLTWVLPEAREPDGYLDAIHPPSFGELAMERGTLFGVHDVLGYNPIQSARYWSFIRAVSAQPLTYNAAAIGWPTLTIARLLNIRYLIVSEDAQPPLPGKVVDAAGGYDLVQVDGWEPRASVVPAWSVEPSAQDALLRVTTPFDPAHEVVLEGSPGITPVASSGSPGSATYAETDPEHATVTVDASTPSVVLVRTAWDPGWSATVDGRPSPVLRADYLLQGVAVGAGHHVIALTYRDAAVMRWFWIGAAIWGLLLSAVVVAGRRRRPRVTGAPPTTGTRADPPQAPATVDAGASGRDTARARTSPPT